MSPADEKTRRRPAVAGMFYPGDAAALAASVADCLARGTAGERPGAAPARAIISPHAGYVYSGWLAGAAFRSTEGRELRHAVVLSPSHRHAFTGLALPSGAAYAMPGFDMPINAAARAALVARGLAHVEDAAHDREHGVETQLPFLHALHPDADVVPLVIGRADDTQVAAAIDFLNRALDGPLFVLSSDLSHFLTQERARVHDAETARLIETGEGHALTGAHACGAAAIRGFLASETGRGTRPTRLGMATSADAGGDTARVVGYGAWAFHGAADDAIATDDRATLLRTARAALASRTRRGADPRIDEAGFAPSLRSHGAAFVTLTAQGRLRGCIGSLKAHRPLVRDVAENAISAGHADPRFPAVTVDDLDGLRLKIAVLGPTAPMRFETEDDLIAQLRPGEDGLILSDLGRRGTFLPMVWESLPEPAAFLTALKRKAGLAHDHWSPSLQVLRYRAESFAET